MNIWRCSRNFYRNSYKCQRTRSKLVRMPISSCTLWLCHQLISVSLLKPWNVEGNILPCLIPCQCEELVSCWYALTAWWREQFSSHCCRVEMSPPSSDVITPALVQEGTSQCGVSFPPPTSPFFASAAYPQSHSAFLSLLWVTVSRRDVRLPSHPLIKAFDLNCYSLLCCCVTNVQWIFKHFLMFSEKHKGMWTWGKNNKTDWNNHFAN